MSLFKYFKVSHEKTDGSTSSSSSFPDPSGPLSEKMPATSIEEANKEVNAKYAAENGTINAIRPFCQRYTRLER